MSKGFAITQAATGVMIALSLFGGAFPAFGQTPTGIPTPSVRHARLQLVDSKGKVVAPAILSNLGLASPSPTLDVVLNVKGYLLSLGVDGDQTTHPGFERWNLFYFHSSDCTGPTFYLNILDNPPAFVARGILFSPGATVYVPKVDAPVSVVPSEWSVSDAFSGTCYSLSVFGSGNPSVLYPLVPLVDLDTIFSPPFHLR